MSQLVWNGTSELVEIEVTKKRKEEKKVSQRKKRKKKKRKKEKKKEKERNSEQVNERGQLSKLRRDGTSDLVLAKVPRKIKKDKVR